MEKDKFNGKQQTVDERQTQMSLILSDQNNLLTCKSDHEGCTILGRHANAMLLNVLMTISVVMNSRSVITMFTTLHSVSLKVDPSHCNICIFYLQFVTAVI